MRWYLLGGAVVVGLVVLFLIFGGKASRHSRGNGGKLTDNPLEMARQALSRETDFDTCRSALTHLNDYLGKNEKSRPRPLSDSERAALRERFDLEGGELAEIDGDTFTPLDGHYLDLSFLLRDAAAALDVEIHGGPDGKRRPPPLRQAEAAFMWCVHQVRLEESKAPPLPPQFVLRRGWGTPLERALVFLALLRHVGTAGERFTGCLVWCPDQDGEPRLWACGVLVNDEPDLYLFDPRLGLAVPGPKGEGVATLAAARTDPGVLGQLTVSDAHRYDVTPDQAAKAELRYVCCLSAVSPRMRVLQHDLLPPAVKVRLAVNSEDEVKLLTASAKAQLGPDATVRPWRDGNASGPGVMRRFLPPEDGGVDGSKPLSRREYFVMGLVPWLAMPPYFLDESRFPPRVGLGQRVRTGFAHPFIQAALEPHQARDEVLRGRFDKAVPELVEMHRRCQDAQDRLKLEEDNKNLGQEAEDWIDKAFTLYADQQRAAGNPQKLDEANRNIDALWKAQEFRAISVMLDGTRSWPLRLETLYQRALAKHEQAERLQFRSELDREDEAVARRAVEAWKEAVNVWQQYLDEYRGARVARADANSPVAAKLAASAANAAAARAATAPGAAVRLLGRAEMLSGNGDGAVRTWRLPYPTTELEKVGNLYLAGTAHP
jgi:hypothetical protein